MRSESHLNWPGVVQAFIQVGSGEMGGRRTTLSYTIEWQLSSGRRQINTNNDHWRTRGNREAQLVHFPPSLPHHHAS